MTDDELIHFGIKGMKWGVRRYQNEDGSYTPAGERRYRKDRKTKLIESVESKKAHVRYMQKQAGDRIQFYGGKNTALNAIEKEAEYKRKTTTAKAVTAGSLIAAGAAYIAGSATGSIPAVAVSATTVALGAGFIANRKNKKITRDSKEQYAYTLDSDYGSDVVVKKVRG